MSKKHKKYKIYNKNKQSRLLKHVQIVKGHLINFRKQYKDQLNALFIIVIATLLIFNGVLNGQVISNANHLYNFEPWLHYKTDEKEHESSNYIMSDNIDGLSSTYYQVENLQKGEIPLWFYNEQLGFSGFFNIVSGFSYPLRFILWPLFGVPVGWSIGTILKFISCGFFMFLFLSRLKVNKYIATAIAIGFTFGSNNIGSNQTPFSTGPMTAPIVFYYCERLIQRNKWSDVIWVVLSLVILGSSGLPHVTFFFAYWTVLYIIIRLIFLKKNKKQLLLKFLTAGILSILIFMPFLLATAEYTVYGFNITYRENYGLRQLDILSIFNVFFANIFGDPLKEAGRWIHGTYINVGIFVGFMGVISVLTGGLVRAIKSKDVHILFFLIGIVILIFEIYALPFEKLENLTNLLPLFKGNPAIYHKTVLQFFIAIVGALGLQYLWETNFIEKQFERIILLILTLLIGGGSIGMFIYFYNTIGQSDYVLGYLVKSLFIVAISMFILISLIFRSRFNELQYSNKKLPTFFGGILIWLFIIEAMIHSNGWISYSKPKYWFPEVEMTKYLKENIKEGRTISLGRGPALPETMAAYGLPVAAGRASVPKGYQLLLQTAWEKIYVEHPTQTFFDEYKTDLGSQVWDLVDVRYFLASRNLKQEEFAKYGDKLKFHRLKDGTIIERIPTPRHAILARDGVVFEDEESMAKAFTNNWDIHTQIAVDSQKDLINGDSEQKDLDKGSMIGEIMNFNQKSNLMEMDVDLKNPGYLVLSSYYYPGWNAYIDGKQVDTFRAYKFLTAIKLTETGKHRIDFKYEPKSVKYGIIISLGSIFVAIVLFIFLIRQEDLNLRKTKNNS